MIEKEMVFNNDISEQVRSLLGGEVGQKCTEVSVFTEAILNNKDGI